LIGANIDGRKVGISEGRGNWRSRKGDKSREEENVRKKKLG
jgi:hypothetical protein